jgi:uncharacterized protein with GYD domain
MPRYLSLFKYSVEGQKGFLKEKAAGREAALRKALESAGGKLEAVHWAVTGEYSGFTIFEVPDSASNAALGAHLRASGVAPHIEVVEILTSSEIDQALTKSISYRPPGG